MSAKIPIYSLVILALSYGFSGCAEEKTEQEELANFTIPVPEKFIDYVKLVENEKRDIRKIFEAGEIYLFPSAKISYSAETFSISGKLSHSEAMEIVKLSNLLTKMNPQEIFEYFLDEELTREITR